MSLPVWLDDDESKWLAEQAHTKDLVIEFGGKATLALSCAKRVVSVASECNTDTKHLPHLITIVGNLRDHAVEELLTAGYARQADMIYIDAEHTLDSVTKDIWLAKRLLAPQGILCGHGFCDSSPGIQSAVSTMLPYYSLPAGTIWKSPG